MRRFWRAAKELFRPDLDHILDEAVIDAELALLRAQHIHERAQADLWCAEQRLKRLRAKQSTLNETR
jgi:hypothetical protein